MKRYKPRNKTLLKKKNLSSFLKLNKLKKKKWSFFKDLVLRKKRWKTMKKPKKKKLFFKERFYAIQQLKIFYGYISKIQLKNLFLHCLKKTKKNKKSNILNIFFEYLEKRIDIILVRVGIASSIFHSKQLIKHKKILINNELVLSPSFLLQAGDKFQLNSHINYSNNIYDNNFYNLLNIFNKNIIINNKNICKYLTILIHGKVKLNNFLKKKIYKIVFLLLKKKHLYIKYKLKLIKKINHKKKFEIETLSKKIPKYIIFNKKIQQGFLKSDPKLKDIQYPFKLDLNLIIDSLK